MHNIEPRKIELAIKEIIDRYIKMGDNVEVTKRMLTDNGFILNLDPFHFPPHNESAPDQFVATLDITRYAISSTSLVLHIKIDQQNSAIISEINVKLVISSL